MDELWNSIFGTAWETLTKATPHIGAFLLDKKSKTAKTDFNLTKILNIHHAPEYDELADIIAMNTPDIVIAQDDEDITAGFVLYSKDMFLQNSGLPICTQAQFASAVTQSARSSLLALVQIQDYIRVSITKEDVVDVLTAIIGNTPEGTVIAAADKNRFWLYIKGFTGDKVAYLEQLQNHVRRYTSECTAAGAHPRSLTFSAGCGADVTLLSERMQTAEFTLFDAATKGVGMIGVYSDKRYEQQKSEYENMRRFNRLIAENLFVYNFQPIVSARTGDILAYEALMRTEKDINMYPLEILGAATKLGRLYDIEKATMHNTLAFISANQEVFADRKLFVNSIPASILSYNDWEELVRDYGELMEKLVIEITESTELDDDKLAVIHDRFRRSNISLAVDDYGTGYSNTANLLRYKPEYVKIDRSLIEGINEKTKMQKLVSGIIEFIHENGYLALAEGVETSEELKTMILLGSDLIQGYYISKPKPFALHEITDSLRREIVQINLAFADGSAKVYNTSSGSKVSLSQLVTERYGSIFIDSDSAEIEGIPGISVNCPIIIKDGIKTKVTLNNVSLTTEKDAPVIALGIGSELELNIVGDNLITQRGIWVPQTTTLRLTGEGSLHIKSELVNCYGIGVDKDHSPGAIYIDMSGRLVVEANGENSIGIGGGRNVSGTTIQISAGDIQLVCEGGNCVAIGNFDGNSVCDIQRCHLDIVVSATNAVGIGSLFGKTDVYLSGFHARISHSGLNLCGIGSLNEGKGRVDIDSGTLRMVMRGRTIACVGSVDGAVACTVRGVVVNFDCEGGNCSGVGDLTGSGDVSVSESGLDMLFLVKEGIGVGSRKGITKIENCRDNIKINE